MTGALQDLACHSFPALPLSCDFGTLDKCPQAPPLVPQEQTALWSVARCLWLSQEQSVDAEGSREEPGICERAQSPGEGYGSWGGVSVMKAEAGPAVGDGGEPSGRGEDSTLSSRRGAWEVAGNFGRTGDTCLLFVHGLLSACKAFSHHVQTAPASTKQQPLGSDEPEEARDLPLFQAQWPHLGFCLSSSPYLWAASLPVTSKSHAPVPTGWYLRTRLSWKQEAAAPAHRRPAQGPLVCRRLSALVSMGPTWC